MITADSSFYVRMLLLVSIVNCVVIESVPAQSRTVTNHLVLTSKGIDANYKEVLERKLFVTPADYGRALFIIGGKDGEYAVALYSDPKSDTGVSITYTKAERNLGDATWQLSPNRVGEDAVRVKRNDMSIAKTTATSVSHALREMTQRTRQRELNPNAEPAVLGGIDIEFSIKDKSGNNMEGLLTAEMKGKDVVALRSLAQLLIEYSEAVPSKRVLLSETIARDANALAEKIKSEK